MAKRSPRRILVSVVILLAIGGGVFAMVGSCSDDISPDISNVILETKGKKYLYSSLGSETVKQQLEAKSSPAAMADLAVYKDGDAFYVDPMNMRALVNLMSGNVETFDYKEKSYDGYVTIGTEDAYKIEQQYVSTSKVGKQAVKQIVTLTNTKGKTMLISWNFDPSTGEHKAIKNCEVRGFWFQTNPQPGETVISSEDFLVVPAKKLAKFFGCKIAFDRETKVFTVKL
ncbi:MAG: hypothetical protein DCO96_16290 [Fluviicola sp. XM-24bin1]|mgnify:CR=1 FL=1|nr:MAG: hypothetical protein DCO96_16290 [Fluviicola sp. XM-24bin1]